MRPTPARTQVTERLFCLTEENPKTALKHYSYFLVRPEGNILFHPLKKTSLLKQHEPLFVECGGIKLQLLTHDAEASPSCEWVHQRFGAGLYFHSSDAPQVTRKTNCPVTFAFSSRHHVYNGLEAIPLTGHTLGFSAYKLTTPNATFLFTGDFLTRAEHGWIANVHKLLMQVGIANLDALKTSAFDAVLPNVSKGHAAPPFYLSPDERLRAIDGAIARLTKNPRFGSNRQFPS